MTPRLPSKIACSLGHLSHLFGTPLISLDDALEEVAALLLAGDTWKRVLQ
ncbi:MAG: hypothetical protein ABI389_14240 [Rhodanobacter sp.]